MEKKLDGKEVKHSWRTEELKIEAKSKIKFCMPAFRNGDVKRNKEK